MLPARAEQRLPEQAHGCSAVCIVSQIHWADQGCTVHLLVVPLLLGNGALRGNHLRHCLPLT